MRTKIFMAAVFALLLSGHCLPVSVQADAPTPVLTASTSSQKDAAAPAQSLVFNKNNPYTNMSNSEFTLLQKMAAELNANARAGLESATAAEHAGRYGEDNYIAMRKSFSEAAAELSAILSKSPVDAAKVGAVVNTLKALVLDIDDVFVYNPGYLNHLRNWNECKRILRRVDGLIYREGALRRVETIWDSNSLLRGVGQSLNVHGLLSGMEDNFHRTNLTEPIDNWVGRHGGGRGVTHVWMIPCASHRGELLNDRSEFNETVTQY